MWSPQQEKALDEVGRWINSEDKDRPFFQLAGYAGTGKTTLAKHLAASVGGRVYFAAYTGKAAHVLMKAGVPNASTIHKLIYKPKDRSQKRLKELEAERAKYLTHDPIPRVLIEKLDKAIEMEHINMTRPAFQLNSDSELIGAALVVVDEYSMIDEQMGNDLLSFGVPVLALGDPGQLPPVYGKGFFSGKPDILLTEIHRQAADNPIIRMSRDVREGRALTPGNYGDSRVIPVGRLPKEELAAMVLGTEQLLVGRNATRMTSNGRVRELKGYQNKLPCEGDKLVCLRNNHDQGLLNGQIWTAREDAMFADPYAVIRLLGEDGQKLDVNAHVDYFHGGKPDIWTKKEAEEFDYGYALTVHKSQGSQWSDVLLFDEWYNKDRKEWLYTAITRAAERIDIVLM